MIAHQPSDGDILCFPSYLLHDVDINRSNRQRITIAFNAKIKFKEESNIINMPDRSKKDESLEK
jgi:ectoine hydroxylase-related dioxygenase (phytanoyl-CoA dioxygenase family)